MKITWLGHSSFLIEDSKGKKILTDPFDETLGYNIYTDVANLITVSHHHFDHDYISLENNNSVILDEVGLFYKFNIYIQGISSYHDNIKGAKRGENIIYIITVDNYRICHLGDLGHILSTEYIDKLGNIDILLIPVGGNYTIDGKEAAIIAKSVNAHIVIPMHYKTPYISFPIDGVETFITNMKNADRISHSTLEIQGDLHGTNIVKILDPIPQ